MAFIIYTNTKAKINGVSVQNAETFWEDRRFHEAAHGPVLRVLKSLAVCMTSTDCVGRGGA